MIIKDFFINLTILVSLLFFYSQILIRSPLTDKSSFKLKLTTGMLEGLLSNVLMQFSIHIESTLIDLRYVPTILLAYYGGAIPALISSLLTIIGRYFISASVAFYFAALISIIGTLFSIYISKSRYTKSRKIISMLTVNNLFFSISLMYLVQDTRLALKVSVIYWIVSYLSTYLAFSVLEFIRKSQMLFKKYQTESKTDGLTGLNNVRKFDEVFNRLVNDLKANQQELSLLYIDIDYFKKVNDAYGHLEGDVVLRELGGRLQNNTRPFDIVSRNGGEEFTVVLLDCSLNKAVEIAERIRGNVEHKPFVLGSGKALNLTISIGVASYQETTNNPEMLIDDADKALYKAKHSGRNKVCIASI